MNETTLKQHSAKKKEKKLHSEPTTGSEYLSMSQDEIDARLIRMRQKWYRNRFKDQPGTFSKKVSNYFESLHQEETRKITAAQALTGLRSILYRMIEGKPFIAREDEWIPIQFAKYLVQDESCELDLKKGILFCGSQGCGKSTLMKAGMALTGHSFQFRRVGSIKMEIEEYKSITALKPYLRGNWCFDDIGQEDEDVVVYSRHNIIKTLINTRITTDFITHGTTNLMPEEIEERYGKVVSSRFNEMFNPVVFSSNVDCRKL